MGILRSVVLIIRRCQMKRFRFSAELQRCQLKLTFRFGKTFSSELIRMNSFRSISGQRKILPVSLGGPILFRIIPRLQQSKHDSSQVLGSSASPLAWSASLPPFGGRESIQFELNLRGGSFLSRAWIISAGASCVCNYRLIDETPASSSSLQPAVTGSCSTSLTRINGLFLPASQNDNKRSFPTTKSGFKSETSAAAKLIQGYVSELCCVG